MDLLLKTPAALADNPGSVPSTHTGWFITACNSRSRESDAFFGTLQAFTHTVHIQTSKHIHTDIT